MFRLHWFPINNSDTQLRCEHESQGGCTLECREILKSMPRGHSDTSYHPQVWWGALGNISCFKPYSKLPLMERTLKATEGI